MTGQRICKDTGPIVWILFIWFGLVSDLVEGSSYCWYYHEENGVRDTVYCESGCCTDYGKEEDICCFSWTIGIVLGVCLGSLTVVVAIVVGVLCCVSKQQSRRNRTGAAVETHHTHIANTVVYTGAAGYAYPHPPSAFYPGSQFPNTPPGHGPPPVYPSGDTYTSGTTHQPEMTSELSTSVFPPLPLDSNKVNKSYS